MFKIYNKFSIHGESLGVKNTEFLEQILKELKKNLKKLNLK